jgi:DNA-binding NarL/FixJ family response regulator
MSLRQVELEAPHVEFGNEEHSGLHFTLRPGDRTGALRSEALWVAAIQADADAVPTVDLSAVWQDVLTGRLAVCGEGGNPTRRFVVARTRACTDASTPSATLSRIETSVVVRVLCGDQQKLVAVELGMACSTASKWYTHALAKLRLDGGAAIPLPLVIAAQSWASGLTPAVGAKGMAFEHQGAGFFLLSVPKPTIRSDARLTVAEQEVAKLLVLGASRDEIAIHRSTSTQTVACQLRGIFSKYRLTGRHALIREGVRLGWFRSPGDS